MDFNDFCKTIGVEEGRIKELETEVSEVMNASIGVEWPLIMKSVMDEVCVTPQEFFFAGMLVGIQIQKEQCESCGEGGIDERVLVNPDLN